MNPQSIISEFHSRFPGHATNQANSIDIFHQPTSDSTSEIRIGHLNYHIIKTILTHITIIVRPEFKQKGVSRALLAYCLLHNPDITAIEVELTGTNEEVYKQAISQGKSSEAAFKQTPAYRIRSALGFQKVEIIDPHTHQFICRR